MKKSEIVSGYMGTKEASELWSVPQNTISRWCREKKILAEQDAFFRNTNKCAGDP